MILMKKLCCWACGKFVAIYYPKDGDGSMPIFRKHKKKDKTYCQASHGPAED
jgi:hypothetical protein